MHAVIFEVWPREGRTAEYFAAAAALKSVLETMPGFISVERFESVSEPGKFLSLSFWDSEEAIANWRRQMPHRKAQAAGRGGIFADYRLRVAAVVRDYGMSEREQAPGDSREAHDRSAPAQGKNPADGLEGRGSRRGIGHPGRQAAVPPNRRPSR